jgi:hypothetical protein
MFTKRSAVCAETKFEVGKNRKPISLVTIPGSDRAASLDLEMRMFTFSRIKFCKDENYCRNPKSKMLTANGRWFPVGRSLSVADELTQGLRLDSSEIWYFSTDSKDTINIYEAGTCLPQVAWRVRRSVAGWRRNTRTGFTPERRHKIMRIS